MSFKGRQKSETADTLSQKRTVPCQKTLATAEKINYNSTILFRQVVTVMSNQKIQELRKKIDEIDDKLIDLLNERARIVIEVGNIKKADKLDFHSPAREREILERLTARNKGPFPQDTLKAVYHEILSSSLSLERPLKVAYLGPRATFTHMAGMQQFGLDGAVRAGGEHQGRVQRSGTRPGRLRRRAHRELHRGRGELHPRHVHRFGPQDLRRDHARGLAEPA